MELFATALGYERVYGLEVERDWHSPLYDSVPKDSIRRINPKVFSTLNDKCIVKSQLTEQLDEAGQETLTKLIRSQHEIDSITARENFILGFRLGVRIMAECLDDNDGDIRSGGD